MCTGECAQAATLGLAHPPQLVHNLGHKRSSSDGNSRSQKLSSSAGQNIPPLPVLVHTATTISHQCHCDGSCHSEAL